MKKKILSVFLTLVLVLSFSLVAAVPVSAAGTPTIDGVIEADEWGTPLCTAVSPDEINEVTVYAHVTMDALYLAFDTNDMHDNRGEQGLDVLDINIGLVGDEVKLPWRYVLVSKVYADGQWGDSWDEIDNGYYASWADTWDDLSYYHHVPVGLEMVTSFDTGNRVTEVKVPMSLMFDETHGWDGPNVGDALLLGGTFSGESIENLFWPTGIDHGTADTYAEVLVQQPSSGVDATITINEDLIAISVSPSTLDFGKVYPGHDSDPQTLTIENMGSVAVDLSATTESVFYQDNLRIDEETLAIWTVLGLASRTHHDAALKVRVPGGYPAGIQIGTIIFWAEAVSR